MNKKTNSDLIKSYTDSYFLKSKEIIKKNGDIIVTYAIFIRRPGIIALKIAIDWIKQIAKERNIKIQTSSPFKEGDHLLLTGDPALIGVACSIVSDITNGKYNLLKWDKQERKYYPISINLYEKGEIDDN